MPVRFWLEAPIINNSMKLFTNGCSFTWGAEIYENELKLNPMSKNWPPENIDEINKFREGNVWSGLLHKKLNATEMYNLSMGSGSNHRIVRTTFDFFINRIENQKSISDFVAVIQWTEPSRYELYDDEIKEYLLITHRNIHPMSKIDAERKKYLQLKFLEHEKNFFDDYYVQLTSLSSFFKLHDIKYLFCTMNPYTTPIGYYYNHINWLGQTPDTSFLNIRDPKLSYPHSHPNLEGHKHITERIYNRLVELYNI